MDAMEQHLAVGHPVQLGIDRERVMRGALEACPPTRERHEPELAALRHHIALEVRGLHAAIRAPLGHRWRLGGDVEREPAWLVPDRDRLHEGSRRELAVSYGANARA